MTLARLESYGREHATSIYPLLHLAKERKIVNAGTAGKLENFYHMMEDLKERIDEIPLTELVKEMINATDTRTLWRIRRLLKIESLENIDAYILRGKF